MSRPPEFDDLIGPEVESLERDRLRRVHDLLVAAGPPPELEDASPPATPIPLVPRRSRVALVGLAAALAAASFAVGMYASTDSGPEPERVIAMSGPSGATASIEVFAVDEAGNWPMELEVDGLPSEGGGTYELWLTKRGKLKALCGGFVANDEGDADVPMNVPWKLSEFDGWVVVVAGSDEPLLTT